MKTMMKRMKASRFWILLVVMVVLTATATVLFTAADVTIWTQQPLYEDEMLNVEDFGAVGDGATDDTAAFEKALAEAKKQNKPVFVDGGTYKITKTLQLSGQTLIGHEGGAWPADNCSLPTLMVEEDFMDGPMIQMNGGKLVGLRLYTSHTGSETYAAFAESVRVSGSDSVILNCKFDGCTTGVIVDGENLKNVQLENLFFNALHKLGVYVNGTVGKTILKNLEMWTATDWTNNGSPWSAEGITVKVGANEDLELHDIFAFNCHRGYVFQDVNGKGSKVKMVNCSGDMLGEALEVHGSVDLTMEGGSFWCHGTGLTIMEDATGELNFNAAQFKTNGGPSAKLNGGGQVSLTGVMFTRSYPQNQRAPEEAIQIGTDNVTITGSLISARMGEGNSVVKVNGDRQNLQIENNMIYFTGDPAMFNISSNADKNIVIENNACVERSSSAIWE